MFLIFSRESNERIASLEKEKRQPTLFATPPPDYMPKSSFTPKELDFTTPPSKGRSPSVLSAQDLNSPGSVGDNYISDVDTLSVSSTGTTPEFSKMSLGRGRGRPRKNLVVPSTDNFLYDGTPEERDRYLKKKNTEMWRFKKLTSTGSAEYRARENARVKEYQRKKKMEKESSGSESDRKKKLSRERYIDLLYVYTLIRKIILKENKRHLSTIAILMFNLILFHVWKKNITNETITFYFILCYVFIILLFVF